MHTRSPPHRSREREDMSSSIIIIVSSISSYSSNNCWRQFYYATILLLLAAASWTSEAFVIVAPPATTSNMHSFAQSSAGAASSKIIAPLFATLNINNADNNNEEEEEENSIPTKKLTHADITWKLRPPENTPLATRLKIKLGANTLRLYSKLKGGESLPPVLCPKGGRAMLEAYYKEPTARLFKRKKMIGRFGFTTLRGPSNIESEFLLFMNDFE